MDRATHPAYGYFSPVEEYYDSIIRWHKIRNNVEGLMPEYIGYENGVLGGVISVLTAFAAPGGMRYFSIVRLISDLQNALRRTDIRLYIVL